MTRRLSMRSGGSKHSASWWVVLVAGSLIIVFAVDMARETLKSRQVRRQIKTLRQAVAREEDRHRQLDQLIAYLASPTFQEREARLKLGLKKPGERVFVVPPGAVNSGGILESGQTVRSTVDEQQSMAQRWWQYFFPAKDDLHKTSPQS